MAKAKVAPEQQAGPPPAQPFLRLATGAGFDDTNLPNLYAWLQSDSVRSNNIHKIEAGSTTFTACGGRPVVHVPASAANDEMYPTGERISPDDDLAFQIEENPELNPTEVWLLHQVPPGQQP